MKGNAPIIHRAKTDSLPLLVLCPFRPSNAMPGGSMKRSRPGFGGAGGGGGGAGGGGGGGGGGASAPKKPKIAPMMAKSLKLAKSLRR